MLLAREQPHEHVERPLGVEKKTMSAAGKKGIFCPYIFEDDGHW